MWIIVGAILATGLVYSHIYTKKKFDISLNIISENDENHRKIQQIFIAITKNAWQSLAYSPLGAIVSPASEYL